MVDQIKFDTNTLKPDRPPLVQDGEERDPVFYARQRKRRNISSGQGSLRDCVGHVIHGSNRHFTAVRKRVEGEIQ
jgi:hypothetical protein